MGLHDNRFAGEGITLHQVALALNISYSIVKHWYQNHNFPAQPKVLAAKRRLYDLGIKARPVRLNNHIRWRPDDVAQLVEMVSQGYGFNTMAERLGKSALGIRGELERLGHVFRPERVPNTASERSREAPWVDDHPHSTHPKGVDLICPDSSPS